MRHASLTLLATVALIVESPGSVQAQKTITVEGKNPPQWTSMGDTTLNKPATIGKPDGRMQVPVRIGDIVAFRVTSGEHRVIFENAVAESGKVWEVVAGSGKLVELPENKFPHYNHDDARSSEAGTDDLIKIRIKDLAPGRSVLFACNPHSENATGTGVRMLGAIVLASEEKKETREGVGSTARGVEYTVEVDCWDDNPSSPCAHEFSFSPNLIEDEFKAAFTPWWSAYRYPSFAKGSRLLNSTRRTVVGVHIKVKNAAADTFKVDLSSLPRFCEEVWRKKDNTEVIFNKTNIPSGRYCWMRVKPGNYPKREFLGRLSDKVIEIPLDGTWERIYPTVERGGSEIWARLISACPLEFRNISIYCESSDKTKILFISKDHLMIFDEGSREIRHVSVPVPVPRGINQITGQKTDAGEIFVLWLDGNEVARISTSNLDQGTRVGVVPERE
jgi:hypothetical protein